MERVCSSCYIVFSPGSIQFLNDMFDCHYWLTFHIILFGESPELSQRSSRDSLAAIVYVLLPCFRAEVLSYLRTIKVHLSGRN